jgi:DUF1680 family protein
MIQAKPGTFQTLRGDWKDGEVIEIDIPLGARREPVDPQNDNLAATMKGPVMLVNSESNWTPFYRVTDRAYTTYVRNA